MATSSIQPAVLAKAWTRQLIDIDPSSDSKFNEICRAAERTVPLLEEDASSVPFVCRYRTDIVDPMSTKQVHFLQSLLTKHASLENLRGKLLGLIQDPETRLVIQASTSKAELEDLYAPFKPPPKGSILDRIKSEHPDLCRSVDDIWTTGDSSIPLSQLGPKEPLIQLLSSKIAAEPRIAAVVLEEVTKHCRIKTSAGKTSHDDDGDYKKKKSDNNNNNKYSNYHDFSTKLHYLKDHQVLAIRRGVLQKALKMSYDIDGTKVEGTIRYHLRNDKLIPKQLANSSDLLTEAVHDAWTRLLRRRATTRLWGDKCRDAQERAIQVFADNLKLALLAPPLVPPSPVLALDPGFKAGIKCAILKSDGQPVRLDTVRFLGKERMSGISKLEHLLTETEKKSDGSVLLGLGNGHGSQECRLLVQEAAEACKIPIHIELVNEAGASVWSVTEGAKEEFPKEAPAAVASISIGRRLQNPLQELIKVPPKSLGLGMYQHDIAEKDLDERLGVASVDAVATVGVDINTCSAEILQKVPGLARLASKIIEKRPLRARTDLLEISGLGAKTFENCAAFCRLQEGSEPLDATLVHPESYELARWLMRKLSWSLENPPSKIPSRERWRSTWEQQLVEASEMFGVTQGRILSVMENLVDSMLKIDPRVTHSDEEIVHASIGSVVGCRVLPPALCDPCELEKAAPIRGIIGTVRNIADFGAFVDFGGHSDGLLHTSKLGPLQVSTLLIGQHVGVDVLELRYGKVSLAVHGLELAPSSGKRFGADSKSNDRRAGEKRPRSSAHAGGVKTSLKRQKP